MLDLGRPGAVLAIEAHRGRVVRNRDLGAGHLFPAPLAEQWVERRELGTVVPDGLEQALHEGVAGPLAGDDDPAEAATPAASDDPGGFLLLPAPRIVPG